METVLLLARLFMALILAVAGISKAIDPAGARKALIGFGVSSKLAAPVGWLLPIVEIAVAIALIPLSTAWIGAVAALALMMTFAGAIGVNLLRGRTPECNCFGQLHSTPVSWSMFFRNLVLAAVAALIVVRGREGAGLSGSEWLADLKAPEAVNLAVGVGALGLLVTAIVYLRRVLAQQTLVLARLGVIEKTIEEYAPPPEEREDAAPPREGLPVGAPAPDFSLASIGGEQVALEDLLKYGKSVLLLFVSPNCTPCETILVSVKDWQRDYGDRLTIALLSKGSIADNKLRMTKYGATHALIVGDSDIAEQYQSRWTPAAVLISHLGRIASQNVYGDEDIRALLARAVAAADVRRGDGNGAGNGHRLEIPVGESSFTIGDQAPAFSIPDIEGKVVDTADLLGKDTLLLFWDPACPFCQAMSDDLGRFEEDPPKGAPRLLFIVAGELEKAKAASEEYQSRFLHDREFQVGTMFGTRATPSAVLIDREGRIASAVATGSTNVLALAGARKIAAPTQSGA